MQLLITNETKMNLLKGKLSYILASLAIVGAFAGYFLGWIEQAQAVEILWAGLALFGVRRAIPQQPLPLA